jgi:hypothetical protein
MNTWVVVLTALLGLDALIFHSYVQRTLIWIALVWFVLGAFVLGFRDDHL